MPTTSRFELDYFKLTKRAKLLAPAAAPALRIALLADAATQQLAPLVRILLHDAGISSEVYEGHFDGIELEVADPNSALYAFRPDLVIVLSTVQSLRLRYYRRPGTAAELLEDCRRSFEGVYDRLAGRLGCTVIQTNVALPYERQFGSLDAAVPDSFLAFAAGLNQALLEFSQRRSDVVLCDVASLAAYVGHRHWYDERLWTLAKTPCALDHLPALASALADVIAALRGRAVKCLVLDLDNTVWGGIIGDDGLEGIQIGSHGQGETFQRFQHYLLELKRRGIILTVCSKNNPETARKPFQEHPEMVLREGDITVFMANWEHKPDNIAIIRETLNIGYDAMVFLDDNPYERNLVRDRLPSLIVPELPEDPSEYIQALTHLNLFETTAFTAEDTQRAELYRQEAQRKEYETQFSNIGDYLTSMEMRLTIARFDKFHLPRIVQLMQRSNQFNVTTRRRTQAECERLMEDPAAIPLFLNLADRFGDHGLISVAILELGEDELRITDLLMSCRVLSRGVEQQLMNQVVDLAREHGLPTVTGEYIPTPKNGMVSQLFEQFGFTRDPDSTPTHVRWRLNVARYQRPEVFFSHIECGGLTLAAVPAL